jgi:hypothetical protein
MDLRKNEERFACTNAQHSLTMESNKRAIKLPAAYQLGDATRRSVPKRVPAEDGRLLLGARSMSRNLCVSKP